MARFDKIKVTEVAGVDVYRMTDDRSIVFQAGMEIDADGAYHAYYPRPDSDEGLDNLDNAGHPGDWFGVVTDNGKTNGTPVVQKSDDPAPGFFVSTTALEDSRFSRTDPRRYVDAESIPYIVLPGGLGAGVGLGDYAVVINRRTEKLSYAICGDIGPRKKIGEASIAAAKAVGVPSSPRVGGISAKVIFYLIFAGSGDHRPKPLEQINAAGEKLFAEWGGLERITQSFPYKENAEVPLAEVVTAEQRFVS
jgi:hypothetical protein